jgi:hypothetical protein
MLQSGCIYFFCASTSTQAEHRHRQHRTRSTRKLAHTLITHDTSRGCSLRRAALVVRDVRSWYRRSRQRVLRIPPPLALLPTVHQPSSASFSSTRGPGSRPCRRRLAFSKCPRITRPSLCRNAPCRNCPHSRSTTSSSTSNHSALVRNAVSVAARHGATVGRTTLGLAATVGWHTALTSTGAQEWRG